MATKPERRDPNPATLRVQVRLWNNDVGAAVGHFQVDELAIAKTGFRLVRRKARGTQGGDYDYTGPFGSELHDAVPPMSRVGHRGPQPKPDPANRRQLSAR